MARSIDKNRFCSVGECPSCKVSFRHEGYECPGGSSDCTTMNPKAETGKTGYLRHRKTKSSIRIKTIKHYCRVPSVLYQRSKKSHYAPTQRNKFSYLRLRGSYMSSCHSRSCSSEQSSPQPSLIFSAASSSSHSPPSSRNSTTDLRASSPLSLARPQPRIQVASLLIDSLSSARSYELEVVQHPLRTAEFGMANLSRLPLTPPIVVRLTVRDPSGNSIVPEAELPFLVAHLSLFSGDGLTPLDMGSYIGRGPSQPPPTLYGNLVSVVEQLEDLQGNKGLFFLFPDVSIRWRGRYQLGVALSRISSADLSGSDNGGTLLSQARTRAFDAVALHQYRAARVLFLFQHFY